MGLRNAQTPDFPCGCSLIPSETMTDVTARDEDGQRKKCKQMAAKLN